MNTTVDMSKGIYRKIFSCFLFGKRINSVSIGAEAWFWRLHAVADDFGNFRAETAILKAQASPIREVNASQVEGWMKELTGAGLIAGYIADEEYFASIVGFEKFQPANKNGRRIQKYPREPKGIQIDPGESGGIQGNPGNPVPLSISSSISSNTSPVLPSAVDDSDSLSAQLKKHHEAVNGPDPRKPKPKKLPAVETWEPIPEPFNTPAIHDALREWAIYRDTQRKDKWTPFAQKRLFAQFVKYKWTPDDVIARINEAMIAGWRGLWFANAPEPPRGPRPLVLNGSKGGQPYYEPCPVVRPKPEDLKALFAEMKNES